MKNLWIIILASVLALFFAGCGNVPASSASDIEDTSRSLVRTVTDLGGNTVKLPPAEEIRRVVVIAPPTASILLGVIPDTDMIVGANERAFTSANNEIVGKLFPNWSRAETAFVSEGFVSNTEELLKLNPDIVFYYGDFQKSGIENLGIPTVDFMIEGENNPQTVTIAWDNLMRRIFDMEGSTTLEQEWKDSNQKAQEVLSTYKGEKKSALFLFSNTGGAIAVYGSHTYADTWFEKSGLINAAADVKGQAEVSMEQLYEWDPDHIYVFIGSPASMMLSNKVKGQDWSMLTAYKNKTIIDIPQAIYSWGSPCSDSPLMPLWLISRSYPELLSVKEFSTLFSKYYERMYGIELGDELITTVLSPRKPQ
ncbi:iron complex transport system substrate-binding protein [Anaerovirgula multivorans]|uniref:Iron complex transport system substrate-binding protein n=1 Tax=Anaerovirgula multivorans TaxID=312168 RepID=A0A239G931_9FIRM|nr:ABC transporter substrate-binding protein [Anaerovirgula multivorans]SNS65212.1 iron complex transport system substrate-binding protein [Anaerovirgula multivorans]